MKGFFKKLVYFILFTIIIYSILLLFFGSTYVKGHFRPNLKYLKGAYGHANSRFKEVKSVSNVDILFLGSSLAYRGFDTRIFNKQGLKSFNLGSSAQTHKQTYILLKRYLDKLNPKVIIYEVNPILFSSDGIESILEVISNDENDIYSIEMAIESGNIKVYNTLYYSFLRELLNLDLSYKEPIIKGIDRYIRGGYVQKNMTYFKNNVVYDKRQWKLNDNQFIEFEKSLRLIKNKGIDLVLVFAPITSNYYNSYLNKKTFDSILSRKGYYINFNKVMKLDDSLNFYDSHHLNQRGVTLFNERLIRILKESHFINHKNQ